MTGDSGTAPHGALDRHGADMALCLNCGTRLIGAHCHACGQAGDIHRTIGAIGHEIAHGAFHFEGKVWRMLPMLALRPGELTRRYIEGERARFLSPMAVFLFSIFAMFLTFSILGIAPPADVGLGGERFRNGIQQADERVEAERTGVAASLATLAPEDPRRAQLQTRLAELDRDRTVLTTLPQRVGETGHTMDVHTGWARLDHGIEKWKKNPALMLYKLQSSGYKFSWLLIPLSLPFVWLLFFWRRDIRMYDHAVFVTYSIAFMSILMTVLTIAGGLGGSVGSLVTIGCLVAVWHVYRQLRGAYRLRRASALVRTAVLIVLIQVVVVLFSLALIALGLVG